MLCHLATEVKQNVLTAVDIICVEYIPGYTQILADHSSSVLMKLISATSADSDFFSPPVLMSSYFLTDVK